MSEIKEKAWFALYTKPRSEFKAAEQIDECGINYFLPDSHKDKTVERQEEENYRTFVTRVYFYFCR